MRGVRAGIGPAWKFYGMRRYPGGRPGMAPGMHLSRLAFPVPQPRQNMKLTPRMPQKLLLALALGVTSLSGLSGCAETYLPNTDVVETDFNREVIEFCEKYRHAVENRNIALLLEMADPSYYEDGGTVDTSDDIDYAGLKEYLHTRFKQTTSIRYEIRYRSVSEGRKDVVFVDFTYSASYKIVSSETEAWRRKVADNRLELVRKGAAFKVLSGM